MNAPEAIKEPVIYRTDVAKAIESDPVATYRAYRGMEADELGKLPAYMQAGMARYIILGIKPGSFLRAVFSDEFENAAYRADEVNKALLPAYQHFLENGCPSSCWGSSEKVRAWCEARGLLGKLANG